MREFLKQHIYIILGLLCILVMGGLFVFGGHRPFSREAGEVLTTAAQDELVVHQVEATYPVAPSYVVVDVGGAVYNPGVFTLPAGSRVYQAIAMAGGHTAYAERRAVNGSLILQDQDHIIVPTVEEVEAGGGIQVFAAAEGSGEAVDGLLCINAATEAAFQSLPGIGPVIAGNIVNYRTAIGGFTSVEQLLGVPRIGNATLENIRPFITIR